MGKTDGYRRRGSTIENVIGKSGEGYQVQECGIPEVFGQ